MGCPAATLRKNFQRTVYVMRKKSHVETVVVLPSLNTSVAVWRLIQVSCANQSAPVRWSLSQPGCSILAMSKVAAILSAGESGFHLIVLKRLSGVNRTTRHIPGCMRFAPATVPRPEKTCSLSGENSTGSWFHPNILAGASAFWFCASSVDRWNRS